MERSLWFNLVYGQTVTRLPTGTLVARHDATGVLLAVQKLYGRPGPVQPVVGKVGVKFAVQTLRYGVFNPVQGTNGMAGVPLPVQNV